jgi:hypothetical protein
MTSTAIDTFVDMLAYRRPAGSKTEKKFIGRYLWPLGLEHDAAGNLTKTIGGSRCLWSCHTDTVHDNGGKQELAIDGKGMVGLKSKKNGSNCLGADDTSGVWLMREMILAKKPGLYVFHRSEENGAVGSNYIADHTPELLTNVDMAIALDRKGYGDVITHQAGERCCSQAFATDLAGALGLTFTPSSHGLFTDTANYTKLVPECTNLSVGYHDQHTSSETQSLLFLAKLRARLLELEPDKLTVARDPGVIEYDRSSYGAHRWTDYFDEPLPVDWTGDTRPQSGGRIGYSETINLIRDYPHEVLDILEDYGIDAAREISERRAAFMRR